MQGRSCETRTLRDVKGVCLDLDGVLYIEGEVVPGAPEAVRRLRAARRAVRFVTNATMRPRSALVARLAALGFAAEPAEIYSAPVAAAAVLRGRGIRRIAPLLTPEVLEDFAGFEATDESPEAVVVGDMGDLWTAAVLNRALRHLLAGARLIALARTRVWRRTSGLVMDAGPYVAALEYASGVAAEVVGKPAPAIFHAAVESMGIAPREAAMVGDDPESDVHAAIEAGLSGILVLSGKVTERDVPRLAVTPDAIFPSLVEAVAAITGS